MRCGRQFYLSWRGVLWRGMIRRGMVWLAAAAMLAGCASPSRRADDFADHAGFHKEIVQGAGFGHVVYRNAAGQSAGPERRGALHVYIEGDGSPYAAGNKVSANPTPHNPLMLRLMAEDPAPSVYLGRPCYFNLDPGCDPGLWTLRRYSPEIVDSMEAALRAESSRAGATSLEIYGHSGGGTLGVLLAQRVAGVSRVVTIGANLDIAAWCKLHGYLPLSGSLNPVDMPAPRKDLQIVHLVGAEDTNTPPSLIQAAALVRGGETVRIVPDFDHRCCWQSLWPSILAWQR
jgi:hypothetical protein